MPNPARKKPSMKKPKKKPLFTKVSKSKKTKKA